MKQYKRKKYVNGGEISIDDKLKTQDKRTSTSSIVVNPIKELGHFTKRIIPTNMGNIPYSKSNDQEYNNARKDFVNWYSDPSTAIKFEKNTRYDPARLKDFISKGTSINSFKSTAQKQPPVGSKAVFNTPDVNGQEEEILYHPGVGSGVIQHELTHGSALANILGPALLRATGLPKSQKLPSNINDPNFKSTSNSIKEYMSIPSEAYGNFHEFRVKLGLKPGDKINIEQLRKLVKEKNLSQENFFNTFEDDNIVNAINTVADNNKNETTQYAAMGGYLKNTKQYALGGELTQFNEGGTHEQNSLGGIPIGESSSVEEGETKKNNFVYSNRIFLDENSISQYNLPKSLVGKSVADATKYIDNKFKGRNDKISQSTKNLMLSKIAEAQESMKPQEESSIQNDNENQIPNIDQSQMRYGGYRRKMFAGGPAEAVKPSIVTNEAQLEANKTNGGLSGFASNPVVGAVAGGLGEMGQAMFQENSKNLGYTPKEQMIQSGWEKGKDAVGAALPIAGLFRSAEKLGKGLGQSIGGDKGGDFANGFLDPMQNVFSKDTNIGEKSLSLLDPVISGLIMSKKNAARRAENAGKNAQAFNNQFNDIYAYGGNIKSQKYANGGTFPKPTPNSLYPNLLNNFDINSEIILPESNSEIIPTQTQAGFEQYYKDNTALPLTFSQKVQPYLTKTGDVLGSALRYAPIAANAYQLSQLKKPKAERLDRLSNRYIPNYTDLAAQQNIVGQELNNVSSAIQGSGASQGAIRSNLLGAQLNKTKALSNAYMNAEAQNRQQDDRAQTFNLGVDQTNLQQSNTEKENYARDKGNYDTQKSRLIGQLGNDFGNIGKEEVYKKIAKTTTGYSWLGEYQKMNPDATPEEVERAAKKAGILTDSTTKKALGGYLLKNKGK